LNLNQVLLSIILIVLVGLALHLVKGNGSIMLLLAQFKDGLKDDLNGRFERFEDKLDNKLYAIEEKINAKLDESVKSSHKTFEKVLERLTRIDEAQKQMEKLGNSMVSLKEILSNKKSRGNLGEITLYQIVHSVFGDNKELYRSQYTLSNKTIVDLVMFLPEPTGTICIDSKFPLENFQKMADEELDDVSRAAANRDFKKDIKKHIDDISKKYIISGETSDQAIMFIPSESIFAEINAHHTDLIEYSHSKKVWFSSPTTLMAMLTTIEIVLRNIKRSKYADQIQQEIKMLSVEFDRYRQRWDKLSAHIDTVSKDVKDIHITTDKISSKFESIGNAKIDNHKSEKRA
jgi:DNA recombination protein RmuC